MLTLDRAIGDKWLVSSGLAPGDQVIVEGLQVRRCCGRARRDREGRAFQGNRRDNTGERTPLRHEAK